MIPNSSKKQSNLRFEELPEEFDFAAFLADLFGLEPLSAYPVGSWFGFSSDILHCLNDAERAGIFEIYKLRRNEPPDVSGRKRFLNRVHEQCRKSAAFVELNGLISDYEAHNFCRFSEGVCEKCARRSRGFDERFPLCFGQNLTKHASETVMPAVADLEIDESDEFAKIMAAQLGQVFDPGLIKNFHYDFLLGGAPVFIWRFRDFEMEENVFLDILERAKNADIEMLYIVAYANLVSKIPVSIVGSIPYVLLPLAAEEEVQVFDYSSPERSFGKLN